MLNIFRDLSSSVCGCIINPMEPIEISDIMAEDLASDTFGEPALPWQYRNNWVKPKRKRNRRKNEIDLWKVEK